MTVTMSPNAFDSFEDKNTKTMAEYVEEVKLRIAEDEFDGMFTSCQIIEDSCFVDFLFLFQIESYFQVEKTPF